MARNYDKYIWPGGYERIALMDDGETLCIDCVNDDSNPIHFDGENDGWKIVGFTDIEGSEDSPLVCAHCNRSIGGTD